MKTEKKKIQAQTGFEFRAYILFHVVQKNLLEAFFICFQFHQ